MKKHANKVYVSCTVSNHRTCIQPRQDVSLDLSSLWICSEAFYGQIWMLNQSILWYIEIKINLNQKQKIYNIYDQVLFLN